VWDCFGIYRPFYDSEAAKPIYSSAQRDGNLAPATIEDVTALMDHQTSINPKIHSEFPMDRAQRIAWQPWSK